MGRESTESRVSAYGNNFLVQDLEMCCASSNDFTCMSEKCEDMISEAMSQCEFSEDMIDM